MYLLNDTFNKFAHFKISTDIPNNNEHNINKIYKITLGKIIKLIKSKNNIIIALTVVTIMTLLIILFLIIGSIIQYISENTIPQF